MRTVRLLGAIVTIATVVAACSSSRDDAAAPADGPAANPPPGNNNTFSDAATPTPSPSLTPDAACATINSRAEAVKLPADIIWIVDQSGSMNQEVEYVQLQINQFASLIGQSGIDYHVIMIASSTLGRTICVPPPLSNGACGDGPRFKQVDVFVDSNDPLDVAITQYPAYANFLRPEAAKHFVFISDDNPTTPPINSAGAFLGALDGAAPTGMFARRQVHAVYAYGNVPFVGCFGVFGTGAAAGTIYGDLVTQTAGAQGVICDGDWKPVFDAITTAVMSSTQVACTYKLPSADGGTIDTTRVNVGYAAGGHPPASVVPHVKTVADCSAGTVAGGWYFDSPDHPSAVVLCPQTCDVARADPAAAIELQFGCESVEKIR